MIDRDNQQQTVSDVEIGWLTGIIEGEGSIVMQISRRADRTQVLRVQPRIIITNTDQAIIEKGVDILTRLGIGKYVRHTTTNNIKHGALVKKSYKDITYLNIDGFRRLNKLLVVVTQHLVGDKRIRAEVMSEFINRRVTMAKNLNCGGNRQYDETDVDLMLKFLRLTRSKNYDHVSRMLNEYTRGTQPKGSVMMDSELNGNIEKSAEMTGSLAI